MYKTKSNKSDLINLMDLQILKKVFLGVKNQLVSREYRYMKFYFKSSQLSSLYTATYTDSLYILKLTYSMYFY